MRAKHTFLLLLILYIVYNGISQPVRMPIQSINSTSGLPSDVVVATLKDNHGFIWFATSNGIVRWDGATAKVFTHSTTDSISVSGNTCSKNAFIWDNKHKQIVMGTENGLTLFDPLLMTAVNYLSDKKKRSFLSSIHTVYIDKQDAVWLGTDAGIVRFNREKQSFTNYPFAGRFPKSFNVAKKNVNKVFDIRQDVTNDSTLWLATLSGLVKFNKYTKTFKLFFQSDRINPDALNNFIKLIMNDSERIYLGTWNADMAVFNTKDNCFEFHVGPYATNPDYYYPNPVWPQYPKSDTGIWVVSMGQIASFNTNTKRIKPVVAVKNNKDLNIKCN